jgi:hypothetical protein
MRKIFVVFVVVLIACVNAQAQQAKPAAQTALPWCQLGTDPLDAARKPDLDSECIVKVAAAMPVTMMTGSGRQVRCLLPPLTPIVVDRVTGAAHWVLACGNPILSPANWVPQGTRICGPESVQTAAPAPAPAVSPATQAPPAVQVTGEVRVVHEMFQPEFAPAPTPAPQPKKGWWSRNWRWVVPVAAAAGTGVIFALTREKTIFYQPLPPPPVLPPRTR